MKYWTLLLILPLACTDVAPVSYEVYGDAFLPEAAVAVEAVVADSALYTNQVVSLSGTVHAVCQMAGCWLNLQGLAGANIRVDVTRTADGDYAFTVPTDISGSRALAHGLVQQDRTDAATQHHYNSDAGVPVAPTSLSMVASGVMIAPQ